MLVSICQLIIEGMLITTDAGDYRLASFVDEQRMCRLYEKFILKYYTRHYLALSVSASQIPWSLDDGVGKGSKQDALCSSWTYSSGVDL